MTFRYCSTEKHLYKYKKIMKNTAFISCKNGLSGSFMLFTVQLVHCSCITQHSKYTEESRDGVGHLLDAVRLSLHCVTWVHFSQHSL